MSLPSPASCLLPALLLHWLVLVSPILVRGVRFRSWQPNHTKTKGMFDQLRGLFIQSPSTPWDRLIVRGEKLGAGSFGTVREFILASPCSGRVARKKIKTSKCKADSVENEVSMLRSVSGHPNFVQLYDVDPPNNFCADENHPTRLLFERANAKNLRDAQSQYVTGSGKTRQINQVKFWLMAIIDVGRGLWFMHQNNVTHRDIKPDNIFGFSDPGCAASLSCHFGLGDLGVAIRIPAQGYITKEVAGTEKFLPPESKSFPYGRRPGALVNPNTWQSATGDIYSLGLTIRDLPGWFFNPAKPKKLTELIKNMTSFEPTKRLFIWDVVTIANQILVEEFLPKEPDYIKPARTIQYPLCLLQCLNLRFPPLDPQSAPQSSDGQHEHQQSELSHLCPANYACDLPRGDATEVTTCSPY